MKKIESKNFISRQIYKGLWGSHAAELRKIERKIHNQFSYQKHQRFSTIEAERANDLMMHCLRELQLEGEMDEPGLHSLLIKHGEHIRKITQATVRFLTDIDKKYLDECEKSFYQKVWKVRSKELAQSYENALNEFATIIENSRTDNSLSLVNAHVRKLIQSLDDKENIENKENAESKENTIDQADTHNQEDSDHILPANDQVQQGGSKSKDNGVSFADLQTKTSQTVSDNNAFDTKNADSSAQRESLLQKLAKDKGYAFEKKHEVIEKRVWRVFNKLKASVLAFSPEIENEQRPKAKENLKAKHDLQLRQKIEERLRSGDQEYLEFVKKLLDTHEVGQDVKDYFIKQHNEKKIYAYKKRKDSKQKVWRVYHRLTQSVFTLSELSEKPEDHSALLWEIEQKMVDKEYQSEVEALLASQEISDKLVEYFVKEHQKEKERKTYEGNLEKKKVNLNDKAMDVYKLLADSVFIVPNDPDQQSALQWDIERRLTGTSQVDRFYQRKVAELLAAGEVDDEDKTYLAEIHQENLKSSKKGKTVAVSPTNDENALNDDGNAIQLNVLTRPPSQLTSPTKQKEEISWEPGSRKYSGKINQELKWYFTNAHSKYEDRYAFMKMEEDEKRKSFTKRFLRRVYENYKRDEIKEKMQQVQSYESAVNYLTQDLREQMQYLQGQFTPKNKEQRMAICENVLQSMVHLEAVYMGSLIRDRASSRVNQLESDNIDRFSNLIRSVPFSMWATAGATGLSNMRPQKVKVVNFPPN